jgi:hypothetical protein
MIQSLFLCCPIPVLNVISVLFVINLSVHRQNDSSKDANVQQVTKKQKLWRLCEFCNLICGTVVRHGIPAAIQIHVFW